MAKPKTEVSDKEYFKDIYFLYEIFSNFENINECKLFLKDILTSSELRMLKRRWHVVCLLDEGYEIREVAQKAQVSTQTVSKVKKLLEEGHGGLKLALERVRSKRIKKEKTREKIDDIFPKRSGNYLARWIFGAKKP